MNSRRHTLKKILIIYFIAGLLVALLYYLYGQYNSNDINYGYEFDDVAANSDLSASIESFSEIGDTEQEPLETEDAVDTEDTLENQIIVDGDNVQVDEKHYYTYKTTNRYNRLRVRVEPSLDGEIIYRLAPGSTGYVLERGDDWSLIRTKEVDGYSSNSYLSFTELDKDNLPGDFPEEYK